MKRIIHIEGDRNTRERVRRVLGDIVEVTSVPDSLSAIDEYIKPYRTRPRVVIVSNDPLKSPTNTDPRCREGLHFVYAIRTGSTGDEDQPVVLYTKDVKGIGLDIFRRYNIKPEDAIKKGDENGLRAAIERYLVQA